MSRLSISEIGSPNNVITVVSGTNFHSRDMVVQSSRVISHARQTYSMAAGTDNGTAITALDLTITPKFASSLMLMIWMITHEVTFNSVFTVFRDGAIITTTGHEGYNNNIGLQRWSGICAIPHDRGDISSTPTNTFIQYAVPAVDTVSRTYSIACKSSDATANTFYLNRTVASTGADAQEVGVSTGMIMEIAQ